jgi:Flp pilus assembly CpaE family ATPase
MARPFFKILLIEDNPGDAELVKCMLGNVGDATFQIHWEQALLPALDRLARGDMDLVLLDVSLPDAHDLDGLNAIHTHAPSLPVVLVTGWDSDSLALRAVQGGAQDYMVKGKLEGAALGRALQRAIVRQRAQMGASTADSAQPRAMVVGLLGAKGGVGNTTIACHLAGEFYRQTGGKVLLMDLDRTANAIAFLMNAKGAYSILDASADILRLDRDMWLKLVASGGPGVDILQSAGPACQEAQYPTVERIRFIIRFVRTLYQFIVIDMGRLSPFSAKIAEEVTRLYLTTTCDVLGLYEAKGVAHALTESGFNPDQLALVINQATRLPTFSDSELEKMLGVRVEATLPETRGDFAEAGLAGKRLGESRTFQKRVAQFAAGIAGMEKNAASPKTSLSIRLLSRLRGAIPAPVAVPRRDVSQARSSWTPQASEGHESAPSGLTMSTNQRPD